MDERIAQLVNESKFLNQVWLNVQVVTSTYYRYGWHYTPVVGGVDEITNRWRERGVIK